jgi:bifunctional non-homologous end joining protein LigD
MGMLQRVLPTGFIAPCLPTKAESPPSGSVWLHEIKHDGFRLVARKDGDHVRLYSRPGNSLTERFPLIVEALLGLRSRSCIIDGEAVCCDDKGVPSSDRIRYRRHDGLPLRLRPDRTQRRCPAARAACGPQGHARLCSRPGRGRRPLEIHTINSTGSFVLCSI